MPDSLTEQPKARPSTSGCVATAAIAAIVAAVVSLFVSLVVTLILVNIGRSGAGSWNSSVIEEGSATIPLKGSTGELEVFYKRPFASPPSLTFPSGLQGCFVVAQKPESFKLGRDVTGHSSWVHEITVSWKAEGIPGP